MSDILRRGRLSDVPDEKILNFSSSMNDDKWIFNADILVDFAHTVMLFEQDIISRKECKLILGGLQKIKNEGIVGLDWNYEDIHISLESKLIDLVGEDVGGRMHSGRSRNDEVATCIRITLREQLIELMEEVNKLRAALLDVSLSNIDTILPGYTHLQHAQPTTLAHHFLAHAGSLERDFGRAFDAYKRINLCPLGASAFASTGFNIDRTRTQELLGFDDILENSMDAVSSRDFLIETAALCSNIMINLSKMSEEIVLWSSSEFNFIEIHDKYASTSSIMPQKKNPDTAELIRGKSGAVIGSLMSLITICKSLPLSYNRDLQEATPNIWRCMDTTITSVSIMAGIISTLNVNKKAMESANSIGFTTATELADTLVRSTGISFRTAHQIIGTISKSTSSPTLEQIDEVAYSITNSKMSERGLTQKDIQDALDPFHNINRRDVVGGPATNETLRSIHSHRDRLGVDDQNLEACNSKLIRCVDKLMKVVDSYM